LRPRRLTNEIAVFLDQTWATTAGSGAQRRAG
jgi:hypothetical protein